MVQLQPSNTLVVMLSTSGGGYKPHLHWILPVSGFNNELAILVYRTRSLFEPDFVMPEEKSLRSLSSLNQYCQTDKKEILSCHTAWGKCKDAQSQGLVADTHKRCNELHPTKLEGMQTISPSPLHRERIECPATKGAEDILGEGLSRREEEVQAFQFNLGIPNTSMEGGKSNLESVFQLTPLVEKRGKSNLEFVSQLLRMLKKGVIPDTYRVFKVLPSEPSLVIKLDALNTELQYHPAQGFRIQYLEPKGCKQSVLPLSKGEDRILLEQSESLKFLVRVNPVEKSWRVGLC